MLKVGQTVRALYPNSRWGEGTITEVRHDNSLKPYVVRRADGQLGNFHAEQIVETPSPTLAQLASNPHLRARPSKVHGWTDGTGTLHEYGLTSRRDGQRVVARAMHDGEGEVRVVVGNAFRNPSGFMELCSVPLPQRATEQAVADGIVVALRLASNQSERAFKAWRDRNYTEAN